MELNDLLQGKRKLIFSLAVLGITSLLVYLNKVVSSDYVKIVLGLTACFIMGNGIEHFDIPGIISLFIGKEEKDIKK